MWKMLGKFTQSSGPDFKLPFSTVFQMSFFNFLNLFCSLSQVHFSPNLYLVLIHFKREEKEKAMTQPMTAQENVAMSI